MPQYNRHRAAPSVAGRALEETKGELYAAINASITGGHDPMYILAEKQDADEVSITAVANAGGTPASITVTAAAHGLEVDDMVRITGTADYDGYYVVHTVPSTNSFRVYATYVSSQTGTADKGFDTILGPGASMRPIIDVRIPFKNLYYAPGRGWGSVLYANVVTYVGSP